MTHTCISYCRVIWKHQDPTPTAESEAESFLRNDTAKPIIYTYTHLLNAAHTANALNAAECEHSYQENCKLAVQLRNSEANDGLCTINQRGV